MSSYETSIRLAQRAYDAQLPPEDWRDDAAIRAAESTLSELEDLLGAAIEFDDFSAIEFWADEIATRPQPEDISLYFCPDGQNRIMICDDASGDETARWPLYLEALCPGYSPAVALRAAAQALTDARDFLRDEYIP